MTLDVTRQQPFLKQMRLSKFTAGTVKSYRFTLRNAQPTDLRFVSLLFSVKLQNLPFLSGFLLVAIFFLLC